MAVWSDFYLDVLPDLPGAPTALVDRWLLNTAARLCEESKAYLVDLAPINSVANQMAYALTLPADTELVELFDVFYDGQRIDPKSPAFLSDTYGDWSVPRGQPKYFLQQEMGELLLVPTPDTASANVIKVKASLKPALTATGIEDWMFAAWRMTIAAGAKASLMVMPQKPWTDIQRAGVYAAQFDDGLTKATDSVSLGLARSVPRFAGGFC